MVFVLEACSTAGDPRPDHAERTVTASSATVEDIYVLRSLREARSAPDGFCDPAKIGFKATIQDRYSFKAVATLPGDGKVVDTLSNEAGKILGCFNWVPGLREYNFFAGATIAGLSATGTGRCNVIAADLPEPGITSAHCFLVLSNLLAPYVPGVLTTNTVISRKVIGTESDPPGYTQPSIATIRLWRKR